MKRILSAGAENYRNLGMYESFICLTAKWEIKRMAKGEKIQKRRQLRRFFFFAQKYL
jgi:hypothetical protein